MAASSEKIQASPIVQPETAHILFMDIVEYSKLSTKLQRFVQEDLRQVVQATPEFQAAQMRGDLICRPTGDGMALLFFSSVLSPVDCAIQITHALKGHPHVLLRMGIHTGPVLRIPDINAQSDIAGEGIVIAQRVMDLGDARHILLSAACVTELSKIAVSYIYLSDMGSCLVKHGQIVHVYSLRDRHYGDPKYGNAVVPKKMRDEFDKRFHFAPAPVPRKPLMQSLINSIKLAAGFALLLLLLGKTWQIASPDTFKDYRTIPYASPASPTPSGKSDSAEPPPSQSVPGARKTVNSKSSLHVLKTYVTSVRNHPQVQVPDLIGDYLDDAKTLAGQHLTVAKSDIPGDSSLPAGTISFQRPLPGTWVNSGKIIHVRISSGPPNDNSTSMAGGSNESDFDPSSLDSSPPNSAPAPSQQSVQLDEPNAGKVAQER